MLFEAPDADYYAHDVADPSYGAEGASHGDFGDGDFGGGGS